MLKKNKFYIVILLIMTFICFSGISYANDLTSEVKGQTLKNTKVTLGENTIITDDKGNFVFNDVKPGTYLIKFKHKDIEKFITQIKIKKNKIYKFNDIDLYKKDISIYKKNKPLNKKVLINHLYSLIKIVILIYIMFLFYKFFINKNKLSEHKKNILDDVFIVLGWFFLFLHILIFIIVVDLWIYDFIKDILQDSLI